MMAKRHFHPEGMQDAFTTHNSADSTEPTAPADSGAPVTPPSKPTLPKLNARGWVRWTWRQITSMRVALLLLMLLAVAAVPGSTFPQRPQDPAAVAEFLKDNPTFGPWADKLGFLDVYGSPWFSAIYILLFLSLVGCILPRTKAHLSALGNRPPRIPRRLNRFPAQGRRVYAADDAGAQQVADLAHKQLRGRIAWLPTFRVDQGVEEPAKGAAGGQRHTISAERGYLRETGNLLFHLALLGLLISVGIGQALEYRGQAIIVQDRGFVNSVSGYDTFESGFLFEDESLQPFSVVLDEFVPVFTRDENPTARDFTAYVTVQDADGTTTPEVIKVNHPLFIDGAKIYLQGNGYAPSVSITDSDGELAFSGSVPFVPEDPVYTSRGVIKVPDVTSGDQIGMVGYLLPTGEFSEQGIRSTHPMDDDPVIVMTLWRGDLGLDDGVPQNVYELDTENLTQVFEDGDSDKPVTLVLRPGDSVDLPDGLGTMTFEDLPRFVALDLRHDPVLAWVLTFALSALLGLGLSLFTPRRRIWLRTWTEEPDDTDSGGGDGAGPAKPGVRRTVVQAAGLARSDDAGLQPEVDALLAALDAAHSSIDPSVQPESEERPTDESR